MNDLDENNADNSDLHDMNSRNSLFQNQANFDSQPTNTLANLELEEEFTPDELSGSDREPSINIPTFAELLAARKKSANSFLEFLHEAQQNAKELKLVLNCYCTKTWPTIREENS